DERLRGLDDMMGGVLEVRKEDILKMDVPPPLFTSKPDDLWTDEEKRIFGEYEKKVEQLNEEKEEYKQVLQNEWKKLEASIQEATRNFDEIVCKLSERKMKSEMVIYQEELKIANLTYALLLDEELDTRKAGLHNCLTKKKKEKVSYHLECWHVDAFLKNNIVVTRKLSFPPFQNLECDFTKQFADIPDDLLEELFQLYNHRPKTPRAEMLFDTANPYGNCSGSAEDYKDALTLLMKAMDELDSPEHMPDGLDLSMWKHFCLARRKKMESEELVRWKALTLAEMEAFLRRRMDENEKMKLQIENIFKELTWLQEEKMRLQQNVMVQFLLKQGQVELDRTEIPEYTDAILIKKSVVEELNCSITRQGEKKVAAIIEFKDFSKGIFRLEWEHKKMKMQIEDLKEKARDIVILPISKDCQLFLTVTNYDAHIAQHLSGMEQTLEVMDKVHKKNVKNHRKKIRELKKCILLKEQANYELSLELKEMLVSVSERRHVFEAADTRDISEKIAKQRYQEILQQKYLQDLLKEKKEQFEILQSDLE
ncbi:CFA43 protein, partial [Calyptomena viridis]|nr:CFA43 protein [Calyptomena viridis]